MADAHDIPEAIQWHEGMLLSPQHFQEMALRQDRLLHYYVSAMNPYSWGVQQVKFNETLLVGGTLQVLKLEALMPDGLVVSYGLGSESALGGKEPELQVDLTPFTEEMRQKPVTVYLAVPVKKSGESAFKGDLARYDSIEGRDIVDENTGEDEIQVPRLRPRLYLLAAEPQPETYTGFPLARITYANESYSLTDYIPPILRVPLTSPLGTLCTQVARKVREKAVFLSYEVLAPSSTSGMPLVLETKTLIQTMVASLPQFEAVLNSGRSHPFTLYLSLCSLVGNLASLGTLVPPVLPPYDHNDPRASYQRAKDYIFRMIDEGIHESYTSIPFHFEDEMFGVKFDRGYKDRPIYLGVRGQADMMGKEVSEWIQKSWIGSESVIQSLKDKRILGAKREQIERVDDLVPARGVMLFSLDVDSEYILPDEALRIYNTESMGPRPAEIVLYVKKKPEALA